MAFPQAKLDAIFRYPVKGLSPEPLEEARLAVGQTLEGDRAYAIENGPCGFDPAQPGYFPKTMFLMLMRNERLARLRTRYDASTHVLTVEDGAREVVRGNLDSPDGRAAIEQFFATFCADELRGPLKILSGKGHSFSDVARKVASIINLETVAAIEMVVGVPVHPLRFRANLYVTGWPAWREFDLVGQEIRIGNSARLKVVKRIERCAATNVDPHTGIRDLAIPSTLQQRFGHGDCGIYAEVVADGPVQAGDDVSVAD